MAILSNNAYSPIQISIDEVFYIEDDQVRSYLKTEEIYYNTEIITPYPLVTYDTYQEALDYLIAHMKAQEERLDDDI